jgi:hypothetical protein
MTKRIVAALALLGLLSLSLSAQKKEKPWTEWSQKDADKVLADSAWAQTQTETDTSEMTFSPTTQTRGGRARDAEGATNQATNVKYFVRFFSARPIRQALARSILLANKGAGEELAARLRNFAEVPASDSIIMTVSFESPDKRFENVVMQAFSAAETSVLKNNAYLERRDGKRLFLSEYVKPGRDGFGARFIFPRTLDGQPFLTDAAGEVRFYAEFPGNLVASPRQVAQSFLTINRRFKLSSMTHDGQLEY